jgi:hypothetical protein
MKWQELQAIPGSISTLASGPNAQVLPLVHVGDAENGSTEEPLLLAPPASTPPELAPLEEGPPPCGALPPPVLTGAELALPALPVSPPGVPSVLPLEPHASANTDATGTNARKSREVRFMGSPGPHE